MNEYRPVEGAPGVTFKEEGDYLYINCAWQEPVGWTKPVETSGVEMDGEEMSNCQHCGCEHATEEELKVFGCSSCGRYASIAGDAVNCGVKKRLSRKKLKRRIRKMERRVDALMLENAHLKAKKAVGVHPGCEHENIKRILTKVAPDEYAHTWICASCRDYFIPGTFDERERELVVEIDQLKRENAELRQRVESFKGEARC